jgi:hypothetical protein
VLYYVLSLCVNFNIRGFDMDAHRRLVASWRPNRYPTLDIFLPVCGEPLAVLLFYRLVQVSRDQHDGAICVGSCAMHRRAVLMSNGGTTLIEHSEDVHTEFDLRRAGWGLRYIPVPLATGPVPCRP